MEEPKVIQTDNLCDANGFDNPQRGRVYHPDGISPCLNGLDSGNNMPKIKVAARIDSGVGDWPSRQDDRIYDADGISPAIAICRTNHVPNIMEEPKIMQIGSYVPNGMCAGKVVSSDGIAPTVMENHGMVTAVVEPAILSPIRTEEQRQLRKQGIDTFSGRQMLPRTDGVSNTLTTVVHDNLLQEPIKIRQATAQGYAECPAGGGFDAAYPSSKLRRGRVQDNGDVVGAITASADGHCVYEGAEMVKESGKRKDDITFKEMPNGNIHAYRAHDPKKSTAPEWQVTDADNIHPTVTAAHEPKVLLRYRIRKLTPRECFRLMDMDDADIDLIDAYRIPVTLKNGTVKEKPIPKSAKFKLAGNSIVVSCLYHIFRQMFVAESSNPIPESIFDM
ncbi:MAG: DNA cytosine methyltransferase [Muribaculaceae bacterium]|nr:DNA cytosine methyltransferase [Muribaculaceae bacterium]